MSSIKKIVIIGGVAGGASAAARARRLSEDAEVILLERGPSISFANCGLPYHIGGVIAERKRLLVQTAEGMRRRFRIDVRGTRLTGCNTSLIQHSPRFNGPGRAGNRRVSRGAAA